MQENADNMPDLAWPVFRIPKLRDGSLELSGLTVPNLGRTYAIDA